MKYYSNVLYFIGCDSMTSGTAAGSAALGGSSAADGGHAGGGTEGTSGGGGGGHLTVVWTLAPLFRYQQNNMPGCFY